MSIAFEHLCLIVLLTKTIVVEFLTYMGVGGCLLTISLSATHMGTASFAARKVALTSSSMAELMPVFMTFARTWITLLGSGMFVGVAPGWFGWELRKNTMPVLILTLSSER